MSSYDPLMAACSECGEPVNLRNEYDFFQFIHGWERKRRQGGQNHVALRRPQEKFMCLTCMDKRQNHVDPGQLSLT